MEIKVSMWCTKAEDIIYLLGSFHVFPTYFIEATGLSQMRRLFLRGFEENFARSPDGQLEHVFAFPEGSRL